MGSFLVSLRCWATPQSRRETIKVFDEKSCALRRGRVPPSPRRVVDPCEITGGSKSCCPKMRKGKEGRGINGCKFEAVRISKSRQC